MRSLPVRWRWLLICVASLAFIAKLTIAFFTIGTHDVYLWYIFLAVSKKYGALYLYHGTRLMNHPPFMVHVLWMMDILSEWTGIPFPFWLRVPASIADMLSVGVVAELLALRPYSRYRPVSLMVLAAAPASVMISGFHGNTDPVMICFLLLAILCLEQRRNLVLAGVAFGMSMSVKVVPVIFVPMLFLFLATNRRRLTFFISAGLTFLVAGLPYTVQDPLVIIRNSFGYGSFYGNWGFSRVMFLLGNTGSQPLVVLNDMYAAIGKYIVLAAVLIVTMKMYTRRKDAPLMAYFGIIAFTFLVLSPGFGNQYFAWLIPWIVDDLVASLVFHSAVGIYLFVSYDKWAGSFPWFYAPTDSGYPYGLLFLVWFVVGWVFARLLKDFGYRNATREKRLPLST